MHRVVLTDYATIHVHGEDAATFLQAQLSSDVTAVDAGRGQLSAWHDPKGRALAVLTVMPAPDGYFLAMPREVAEAVMRRLAMFVLRSRVRIEAGPPVAGQLGGPAPFSGGPASTDWAADSSDGGVAVRLPGRERWLVAGPAAASAPADDETRRAWELEAVRAGLPEVYPATSGAFVAQMLNLDALGGVSFTKGCFPGQEIIARAHYLGRVKRAMRRFRAEGAPPAPGEAFEAEARGTVVRAAPAGDGCEILAVVPADSEGPFRLADGRLLVPA